MSRPDTALMFSAGFGTRMAPLTDTRPKPLIKVAGEPLFDHALRLLRDAGLSRIVANSHYLADVLSDHLVDVGVVESHEPEILDTGGGLKNAYPRLNRPWVITLNTDAVWTGENPIGRLIDAWDPKKMDGLLVMVRKETASGHRGAGDFLIGESGRLTPGPGAVYTGLQIIKTKPFLDELEPVFPMHRIWNDMLSARRLFGVLHRGGWCDVGRPESITVAEQLLANANV